MNTVFRLVTPVNDMDPFIVKVTVFTKQAKMNGMPYFLCYAYSTMMMS